MESVKELKDWIVSKCKIASGADGGVPEGSGGKKRVAVVTPSNIPEFIIPSSNDISRQSSDDKVSLDDDFRNFSSGSSFQWSGRTSPAVSLSGSFLCPTLPRSPMSSQSAPVSPRQEKKTLLLFGGGNARHSLTSIDRYRGDGSDSPSVVSDGSARAVSGDGGPFPFHLICDPYAIGKRLVAPEKDRASPRSSSEYQKPSPKAGEIPSAHKQRSYDNGRRVSPGPADVYPVISVSSPGLSMKEDLVLPEAETSRKLSFHRKNTRRKNVYFRRRSSLSDLDVCQARLEIGLEPECGYKSASTSPSLRRRKLPKSPSTGPVASAKAVKPPNRLDLNVTPASVLTERKRSLSQMQAHLVAEYGEVKFGFRYLPDKKQLSVLLIRAENMRANTKPDQVNPYAKLYLMPGKVQKRITEHKKHTRNPVFNVELLFHNVRLADLKNMQLKIKLMHKSHNLKLDEFLGETSVHLSDYDLLEETRMWKDLGPRSDSQDLGYLQITTLFQPWENRLQVTVVKAKGLRIHHITGSPDPYVRVEVSQGGSAAIKRQTKTRKKTTDPAFNECFGFSVSPRPDDLRSLAMDFTVYDHEHLRSDEPIGQVRFGRRATEETEIVHWEMVLQRPGEHVTRWHYLMEAEKAFR